MTKRVLVVEDEFVIRLGIMEDLEDRGYEPVGVDDANKAEMHMMLIGADLVITDGQLAAGTNGPQLVRALQASHASGELAVMPKIVGYTGALHMETAFEQLGVPVISKTAFRSGAVLMAKVQELLAE